MGLRREGMCSPRTRWPIPAFSSSKYLEYDEAPPFQAELHRRSFFSRRIESHRANQFVRLNMYRAGSLETDLIGAANSFLRRPKMHSESGCRTGHGIRGRTLRHPTPNDEA